MRSLLSYCATICLLVAGNSAVAQKNSGTLYIATKDTIFTSPADARGLLRPRVATPLPAGFLAISLAANPQRTMLYALLWKDKKNALYGYSLKPDGSINKLVQGPFPADSGDLVVHPNGKYLYDLFPSGFSVRYKLGSDGSIDAKSDYPKQRNEWTGESRTTWSPDNKFLYIATNDSMLDTQLGWTQAIRYRPSDGVLKLVPDSSESFTSDGASKLLISKDGWSALLICLNDRIVRYRRNTKTGRLTKIGDFHQALRALDAIADKDDRVYVLTDTDIVDIGKITDPKPTMKVVYHLNQYITGPMIPGPACACFYLLSSQGEKHGYLWTVSFSSTPTQSLEFPGDIRASAFQAAP